MSITRYGSNRRTSQAVVDGNTIYLAGQIANNVKGTSIEVQTTEALANIELLLTDCGSNKSKILRITVYLADRADFDGMNAAWTEWVDGDNPPARATTQAVLLDPDWRIEMVATARL
jgi:enamine deaminase RidA (YjgF/YER057c/UK114 family)